MPGLAYKTVGFSRAEVNGFPPGKDQLYEVGLFNDLLIKLTLPPVQTSDFKAIILATGGQITGAA